MGGEGELLRKEKKKQTLGPSLKNKYSPENKRKTVQVIKITENDAAIATE